MKICNVWADQMLYSQRRWTLVCSLRVTNSEKRPDRSEACSVKATDTLQYRGFATFEYFQRRIPSPPTREYRWLMTRNSPVGQTWNSLAPPTRLFSACNYFSKRKSIYKYTSKDLIFKRKRMFCKFTEKKEFLSEDPDEDPITFQSAKVYTNTRVKSWYLKEKACFVNLEKKKNSWVMKKTRKIIDYFLQLFFKA